MFYITLSVNLGSGIQGCPKAKKTKENLKKQIAEAASAFTLSIIDAVKDASLQELMELQTSGTKQKPARKKPGPNPKAKKRGPKPKATKVTKPKSKPGSVKAVTKANPSTKKVTKKPKTSVKAAPITKKNKAKLHDEIVAYLSKNSWSSGGAICKKFELNAWTARRHMKQLRKAGKIEVQGEKSKTRYKAKG